MQQEISSSWDEFLGTDASTGERKLLNLDEKEKLYLDCLDAFYNGGESPLKDEEYEQLKNDISFEGSKVAGFSKDEIKFLIANKRFRLGTPILSDPEYDALRRQLKVAGSTVVLHEAPSCSVTTGECKQDMRVDQGKQRLLYIPGFTIGLLLVCELSFWTLGTDPLLSVVFGSIPAYLFSVWFTENIFAQKPLVVQTSCPNCNYLQTVYFGDLFAVQSDGIVGEARTPESEIDVVCPNCKAQLKANRDDMVIRGSALKPTPDLVASAQA